jgi:3-dehydroquinate dehydratase I
LSSCRRPSMLRQVQKSHNIAKASTPRARKFRGDFFHQPRVVAAAHTAKGLQIATRLGLDDVDVVEIRVDALAAHVAQIERTIGKIQVPVLLTVRHPAEGGIGQLTTAQRRSMYLRLLPAATLIDVELRSLQAFSDVVEEARHRGVGIVVSAHYFHSTPSLAQMLDLQRRSFRSGADIFKLAALTPSAPTLARLLEFIARPAPGLRAVMGMGSFGQVSRLTLARAGSVLNYGYLDTPNAPGQWEARELRKLITQLNAW